MSLLLRLQRKTMKHLLAGKCKIFNTIQIQTEILQRTISFKLTNAKIKQVSSKSQQIKVKNFINFKGIIERQEQQQNSKKVKLTNAKIKVFRKLMHAFYIKSNTLKFCYNPLFYDKFYFHKNFKYSFNKHKNNLTNFRLRAETANYKNDSKLSLLYRTKLSYRNKFNFYLKCKYNISDDKITKKEMNAESNLSIFSKLSF